MKRVTATFISLVIAMATASPVLADGTPAAGASSGGASSVAPSGGPASSVASAAMSGSSWVPPDVTFPRVLTLEEAVRILRTRGLDLLVAEATVQGARGDVETAAAVANPNVSVAAGPTFNYSTRAPCSGCQSYNLQWGLSDNGAAVDSLSGKRGLRSKVARAALESAKLARDDARRNLEAQVKQQYVQVVLAEASLVFARQVSDSLTTTADLNRRRYPQVIDEGELSRIEIQKLEADQAASVAEVNLRQARVGLAFLLGARTSAPDFDVEKTLLTFRVPASMTNATKETLLQRAIQNRPDLRQVDFERLRALASLELAKRERFPAVALLAQYSQLGMGQEGGQPMSLTFGVSVDLPVFYQQQGEIKRAKADSDTQLVLKAKTLAQVVSDVDTAFSSFVSSRELVERMQGSLLERAKTARDIVEKQFKAGSATLMDFLDAERTYIATNAEYLQHLADYWTALFQLEQALGAELP